MSDFWTEETVATIKALWAEGYSASSIARQTGAPSRNAVLAKLNRLGLLGTRNGPKKPRSTADRPAKLAPVYVPPPPPPSQPDPILIDGRALRLIDLPARACRYAYGDSDFTFCGHGTIDGSQYCAHHHSVVYTPVRRRKDDDPDARRAKEGARNAGQKRWLFA